MYNENMQDKTSNQVNEHHRKVPNPTGKGGFGDNPENINKSGYWSSKDSISFQYKRFLKMTPIELEEYSKLPPQDRTVAMDIAYSQVIKSRNSLNHAKEITDRTEGKAQQAIDVTSNGEPVVSLVEFIGDDNEQEKD